MIRLFFLALIVGASTICNAAYAATAAQIAEVISFSVPSGKSVIYVYRKQVSLEGADSALRLNGIAVGQTKPNAFMRFEVEPGRNSLVLDTSANLRLDVDTQVGESYFVLLGNSLELVAANVGRESVLASRMLDNEFAKKNPAKVTSFAVVAPSVTKQTPPAVTTNATVAPAPASSPARTQVATPAPQVRVAPVAPVAPAPVVVPAPAQAAAPAVAPKPAPAPAPAVAAAPAVAPKPAPAPAPAVAAAPAVAPKPAAALPVQPVVQAPAPVMNEVRPVASYTVETIPFQAGISSVTVENMAKKIGCRGGKGAGLISEKGPIEIYRMLCDNGTTFQARCELRQCKQM